MIPALSRASNYSSMAAAVKFDQRKLMEDGDAYDRGENALGLWRVSADRIARAATGKGKRSEIDHLNGFIARRGEALGVVTPAKRLLHAIVKLIESK
jgi:hypothetical protein